MSKGNTVSVPPGGLVGKGNSDIIEKEVEEKEENGGTLTCKNLSVSIYACVCIYSSCPIHPSIHLHVSVHPSFHPFILLSIHPFIHHLSIHLSIHLFICSSINSTNHPHVHTLYQNFFLSIYMYLYFLCSCSRFRSTCTFILFHREPYS